MDRLALIAVLLLGVAGCIPKQSQRYSKAGAPYEEYVQVRDVCIRQSMTNYSSYGVGGGADPCLHCGLFESCMAIKGWMVDPNGFAPPRDPTLRCCR